MKRIGLVFVLVALLAGLAWSQCTPSIGSWSLATKTTVTQLRTGPVWTIYSQFDAQGLCASTGGAACNFNEKAAVEIKTSAGWGTLYSGVGASASIVCGDGAPLAWPATGWTSWGNVGAGSYRVQVTIIYGLLTSPTGSTTYTSQTIYLS
jgi:hypothetical protein